MAPTILQATAVLFCSVMAAEEGRMELAIFSASFLSLFC
jgi:hypothetical protein